MNFTATGAGQPYIPSTPSFNVQITGTFVGTVQLERALPNADRTLGAFVPVTIDGGAGIAAFSVPASFSVWEPEAGAQYRLNCTAFTSGTISGRFGP